MVERVSITDGDVCIIRSRRESGGFGAVARLAARWGEHGRVGRVGQGDDDDELGVLLCAVRGEDRGKEEHRQRRAGDTWPRHLVGGVIGSRSAPGETGVMGRLGKGTSASAAHHTRTRTTRAYTTQTRWIGDGASLVRACSPRTARECVMNRIETPSARRSS